MNVSSAMESVSSTLLSETRPFSSFRKRFQDPLAELVPRININENGEILYMSRAARSLLGYKSDAVIPTSVLSYVHSKNTHALLRDISHLMQHGQKPAPWVIRLRTAQSLWAWFVVSAETWHHGEERGVTLHLKTISGGAQPM